MSCWQFLSSSFLDWIYSLIILVTWTSTSKRHSPFERFLSNNFPPAGRQMAVSIWAVYPSPRSLSSTTSNDLFSRRLIISQQGHQHLKFFRLMASLRKSLKEKYDEITLQQMASQQRSLQISKWHLNWEVCKSKLPIKWHLPNISLWEVWWRTLQIFLSSWDICTQIN